jgi:hypothetical protein
LKEKFETKAEHNDHYYSTLLSLVISHAAFLQGPVSYSLCISPHEHFVGYIIMAKHIAGGYLSGPKVNRGLLQQHNTFS